MLYTSISPADVDKRLLLALKNVVAVDLCGRVRMPTDWRVAIENVASFPPARWVRRIR